MKFAEFVRRSGDIDPAVIIGMTDPTGFGVIRNLASHGIPMLALCIDPMAPGLRSRFVARGVCPDPHYDEESYIRTLVDIARCTHRKPVLFPCQDDTVYVAAKHGEELREFYHLPFSPWEQMQSLAVKEEQIRAAWRAGVGVPATAFIRDHSDVEAAAESVPFPAVLKSSEHLALRRHGFGKAVQVRRREDLAAEYARVAECGTLMVQEVIPGDDTQLFTLQCYVDAESRPLAMFVRHKLRQHPRRFGVVRFGEGIWVQDVADSGLALLKELRYHGVAGIEFKRDPRDGQLKFMEVNARHPAGHGLGPALGVNLSLAAYMDALGRPFVAPRPVDGPRWLWISRDVPDSVREILRGEMSAREWLTSLRGTKVDGMFSLSDPLPGVWDAKRFGANCVRARVRS